MDNKRICAHCGKAHPYEYYLPVSITSMWGKDGMCYVCLECIAEKVDRHDLSSIDKMCQFLDVPYDANLWIEYEEKYEKLGPLLQNYCAALCSGKYAECDWFKQNKMWDKCREYDGLTEELSSIHGELLLFLRKKWGHMEGFLLDEYLRMEEYERHTLEHYPFKDEARRDMVRKLAKLSAVADHALSQGENKEATTVLQSYNTLMRELGIKSETSGSENTIESLSELVGYLERTGFLLNYKVSENRDIVDSTLSNMQQYVRRLFSDSAETVNEMFNSKKASNESGTTITDDDIEKMYMASDEENNIDLEDPLSAMELEDTFKRMLNESE